MLKTFLWPPAELQNPCDHWKCISSWWHFTSSQFEKCMIGYLLPSLLLSSSWADPLLSRSFKPQKFFLLPTLSLLSYLHKTYFCESCHGLKNLLVPSSKNEQTQSSLDILRAEELHKQLPGVPKMIRMGALLFDSRVCRVSFAYALFVHTGLKLCDITLPWLCLRWVNTTPRL